MAQQADNNRDATPAASPDMRGVEATAAASEHGRGRWLRDSRFAMFIHWGLYSELAGEWQGKRYFGIAEWIMKRARIPVADYERVSERFNPIDFDAGQWVKLAKAAGMRHIMITAKHHDGFAMFRSEASAYNIVDAAPFGRDPLAELAEACRAEGLRLGFYYSQSQDWHEPDAVGNDWDAWPGERDFKRYLRRKAVPQIEELLTRYGPVAGIWFDTPGPITGEESKELVDLVHRLQPDCLVNSRIGNGLGDYDTLGDQEIPRLPRPGLWETPDTHNDTWAYSRCDTNWKSAREVAERLVRVVSRGGTGLLNRPRGQRSWRGRVAKPELRNERTQIARMGADSRSGLLLGGRLGLPGREEADVVGVGGAGAGLEEVNGCRCVRGARGEVEGDELPPGARRGLRDVPPAIALDAEADAGGVLDLEPAGKDVSGVRL